MRLSTHQTLKKAWHRIGPTRPQRSLGRCNTSSRWEDEQVRWATPHLSIFRRLRFQRDPMTPRCHGGLLEHQSHDTAKSAPAGAAAWPPAGACCHQVQPQVLDVQHLGPVALGLPYPCHHPHRLVVPFPYPCRPCRAEHLRIDLELGPQIQQNCCQDHRSPCHLIPRWLGCARWHSVEPSRQRWCTERPSSSSSACWRSQAATVRFKKSLGPSWVTSTCIVTATRLLSPEYTPDI